VQGLRVSDNNPGETAAAAKPCTNIATARDLESPLLAIEPSRSRQSRLEQGSSSQYRPLMNLAIIAETISRVSAGSSLFDTFRSLQLNPIIKPFMCRFV
jgi:hypothetical protein